MGSETFYHNKTVLVTGGAGSIGRELVKQLIRLETKSVRVFDNNETGVFDLEQELKSAKLRPLIGDIRDKERLERAMESVDIVFHAAALKHVPLCEFNPFDAIKTNIIGTQNVLNASLDNEVEKVIVISTDKAVNPSNVMGATKLLAERLTISTNLTKGTKKTVFSCVRFGNVLASRGSVIPLFKQQIARGQNVTVTKPEMTRFVMSIPKAINLILQSAELAKHGEIFILKMPALRIIDLAETMIDVYGPEFGYSKESISIDFLGERPGEKIHEELMSDIEVKHVYENENLLMVMPHNFGIRETPDFSPQKIL